MRKNVANQRWRVFSFNMTNNVPVTGDAANITAKLSIDFGSLTPITDTNPTEVEDGYYYFDLTQAETDGYTLEIFPESSSANVQVIGVPGTFSLSTVVISSANLPLVSGSTFAYYRGTTWGINISGIGSSGSDFYFTLKPQSYIEDTDSTLQINTSGLVYLNGVAQNNTSGTLIYSPDDNGTISIDINTVITSQIHSGVKYFYDIKCVDTVTDIRSFGSFTVKEPVTHKI